MTTTFTRFRPLVLTVMLCTSSLAGASEHQFHLPRLSLEGVWDSTVTLQVCHGGPILRTFRALNLFARDGSLVASSVAVPPPSLGEWRWLGGRKFRAEFQFLRLGTSGAFEGMTQITREIEMADDGESFTSTVATQLFDLSDNLFQEGCGKEEAKRVF